jgi:uncharacterized lipoprotein YmbA
MNWRTGALLGIVMMLSGCAAPAVRYYSLAAPDRPAASVSGDHPAYGLRLQVSQVPAAADRVQLVVRDPGASPRVQVLNQSLWVAPLRDQIQARLAAEVAAGLGVPDLDRLPGAGGLSVREVTLRVTRFDLVWGRAVWLEAGWTDRLPGARAARVCQARLTAAAGASVSSLVQAQRQLLGRLAGLVVHGDVSPGPSDGSGVSSFGCT